MQVVLELLGDMKNETTSQQDEDEGSETVVTGLLLSC